MFLTHLSCSAEQSWLADIILLFMLCTVRADLLTSYCYSHSVLLADIILLLMLCFTHWHHIAISCSALCQNWLADIILLLTLCSACWHHTAISCSAFCQAELTCWHHTVISCSALLTDIILLLMLCSVCWHYTAILCSAFYQAELTCWHYTVILCSALLTDIVLLSHALLSVKQSWLVNIILLFLMLCSVCWYHIIKYLCFTAELVVKKYKKISFADQMFRFTEIK